MFKPAPVARRAPVVILTDARQIRAVAAELSFRCGFHGAEIGGSDTGPTPLG